jgi:serine/threonine-protein kinase
MIGQIISYYKILEKLGEGGMGVVYKAEDTKLKRTVALKFLPQRLSSSAQDKERFLQEAQSASALNHPNVCTIYDIQDFDGQTFIVMEYVDGKTLRDAKQGISIKQAVDIIAQIAEGLAAAHEKGIVHRDIKGDNIMLRSDGRVQIMDFGLAKLQGASSLTKAGSTIGTTAYMSPEQVQGEEADHRTDIFALGVVMYELLTGQLPFKGAHEAAVMYEIVNVDPQSVRTVKPEIEPDLERIVMKCLEKDRETRHQSARDVAADLKRFKRDSKGKRIQPTGPVPSSQPVRRQVTWLKVVVPVMLLIAVALAAWFLFRGKGETLDSLAVLPFENVGNDQTMDYLSDGITESLINGLSKLSNLTVMSRSSVFHYKGKETDPQKAGKELGVKAVLTGRVTQRGENLIISTELVNVSNNSHIWGDQYNRNLSDIFSVQEEIAWEISRNLSVTLGRDEEKKLTKRSTENTEAYQLYLKGRFHWNKRKADDLHKAVEYYNQAIQVDPNYALAYAGLASTYVLLPEYAGLRPKDAIPKIEAAVKKASELDPTIAEPHAALGLMRTLFGHDWKGAEDEFKRAIELDPGYPTTHHWYCVCLRQQGKNEQSLAEIQRAQELDPLSIIINQNVAEVFIAMRQYDRALEQLKKTLELDPNFPGAREDLGLVYAQQGKFEEALSELQRVREIVGPDNLYGLQSLGFVYAIAGKKDEAVRILNRLLALSKQGSPMSVQIAMVYAGLGEKGKACEWLEKGYDEQDQFLGYLMSVPEWDSLHSDPRFTALLKKMGLKK